MSNEQKKNSLATYIYFGILFGIAIGAALQNIGLGVALGAAVGYAYYHITKNNNNPNDTTDKE